MKKSKLEKWSSELFHGYSVDVAKSYDHLSGRELIIVAAAIFDAALLELIELRLVQNDKEQDDLLGIIKFDAPVSTLSARARLAYLLGLIRKVEADTIKSLGKLRNHLAHRATAGMGDAEVFKFTKELLETSKLAQTAGTKPIIDEMIEAGHSDVKVAEFFIKQLLLDLQMNFDKRKATICRLEECVSRSSAGMFVEKP